MRRFVGTLLLTGAVLGGCFFNKGIKGSGTVKHETRQVPAFTAVDVSGYTDVTIQCQKPQSLEVAADDNLLPLLQTEVKDGVLHIDTKDGQSLNPSQAIRVVITVPDLKRVSGAGAGKVTVSDIKSAEFTAESSGAAAFQLSGEAKKVSIDGSGATKFDAEKLKASEAKVDLSGAGAASVAAKDTLAIAISGAGAVEYVGSPKVSQDISGVGSVKQKAP